MGVTLGLGRGSKYKQSSFATNKLYCEYEAKHEDRIPLLYIIYWESFTLIISYYWESFTLIISYLA